MRMWREKLSIIDHLGIQISSDSRRFVDLCIITEIKELKNRVI